MSGYNCIENNVIQQHSLRSWLQLCGSKKPKTCNGLHYFGEDCHLFEISVVEENIQGSIMPLRVLRGTRGEWCHVGTIARPPGRQRFVMSYFEPCLPYLPFFHSIGKSPFNIYETVGDCPHPDRPEIGWSSYVQIYSGVRMEVRRTVTRTTRTSQAPVDNQLIGTVDQVYRFSPMNIHPAMETETDDVEIIDAEYPCHEECPACATEGCVGCDACNNTGTVSGACPEDRFYVLKHNKATKTVYVDAYLCDQSRIATQVIGLSEDADGCTMIPTDLAIHNGHVVVSTEGTQEDGVGVYTAQIYSDGTMGSFFRVFCCPIRSLHSNGKHLFYGGSDHGWCQGKLYATTSTTCGDPKEVLFIADGVAINDIESCGRQIVAGADGGVVAVSSSNGFAWNMLPTKGGDKVTAVAISGQDIWVGTEIGDLYRTSTGGLTWDTVASVLKPANLQLSGQVGNGAIKDIEFPNPHVGYFISGNQLFSTYDCGDNWSGGCPRFQWSIGTSQNWSSQACFSTLAVPQCGSWFDASHHLVLGANDAECGKVLVGEPIVEGLVDQVW